MLSWIGIAIGAMMTYLVVEQVTWPYSTCE
jgi:hypothetical protein